MASGVIKSSMGPVEWAMLVGLSILWGSSFFFVEIALEEWPPISIVAVRVWVAALVLWLIVRAARWPVPRSWAAWRVFFALGLGNNVLPFLLIVWGQKAVASGLAAILNASAPIFSVLVAGLFLRDERMTLARFSGAVLGLAGVALLVGPSALDGLDAGLLAKLAILGAALSYAISGVYARRLPALGINPIVAAAGQLLMSALIMTVILFAVGEPGLYRHSSARVWFVVGGLAILSTSVAYIFYFRLIATAGATNAILVTLLIPVTAIVLGALFLDERLEPSHFLGMSVIALGLLVIDGRPFDALRQWLVRRKRGL